MRLTPLLLTIAGAAAACTDSGSAGSDSLGSNPGTTDGSGSGGGLWQVDRWNHVPPTSHDYGPHEILLGQATFGYLTQVATSVEAMPLLPPGIGGSLLSFSLLVEATGQIELFALFVPDSAAGVRRPLLTAFHGFGTSHRDIDVRTSFFVEAEARDWFLVAPLQRSLADPTGNNFDISYASAQSQLHVEAVISYVMENYPIDRDRLYGVGFSMGGGSVLSYAARHRDRASGAFAAVVNHTGTVALADEYRNLPAGSPVVDIMHLIFGGPPSLARFEWQRSSVIELDPQGQLLVGGRHMAGNLSHVPVQTWYNAADQLAHLPQQAAQLDLFMQGVPGAHHSLVVVPGGVASCGTTQHCWDSLDQVQACDWLAQQSLETAPSEGQLLMDRKGRWEYFDVDLEIDTKFGGLVYVVDVGGSSLTLRAPDNLVKLETSLETLGFGSPGALKLVLEGFGPGSAPLTFLNVPIAPASVIREGLLINEDCGLPSTAPQSWCYDATTGTLVIRESDLVESGWRINF